jgi:hypothetical protein
LLGFVAPPSVKTVPSGYPPASFVGLLAPLDAPEAVAVASTSDAEDELPLDVAAPLLELLPLPTAVLPAAAVLPALVAGLPLAVPEVGVEPVDPDAALVPLPAPVL